MERCSLCGGAFTQSAPPDRMERHGVVYVRGDGRAGLLPAHDDSRACIAELKRLVDQLRENLKDEIALKGSC